MKSYRLSSTHSQRSLNSSLIGLLLISLSSLSLSAQSLEPGWGSEPVEQLSETRSRICLNGLWQFLPDAALPSPTIDSSEWGLIHVPGAWANAHWSMQIHESIHYTGTGDRWENVDYKELESAWYHRELHIPADWSGSKILLDLTRVSTDAVVFINGEQAGEVFWPSGQVDITSHAAAGQTVELGIQVFATISEAVTLNFMASFDAQVTAQETKLNHRGIIGEVFLLKEPMGGHIEDVFVKTSVRNEELALEIQIDDLDAPADLSLSVEAVDASGTVEFSAETTVQYHPENEGPIEVSAPWIANKLWDLGEPNLYTLRLTVTGPGISDTYTQRFGFREFWIEGRQFYINNRPVNLRPLVTKDTETTGNPALMRAHIRRYMEMGYNAGELWPFDHLERGVGHYRKLWKEIADEEGFGLIATLGRSNRYVMDSQSRNTWHQRRDDYARDVMPEIIDFRNHPSVLFWVNSANFFAHKQDQNPRMLGRVVELDPLWHEREAAGLDALSIVREADPTRPASTHSGAQVGDVFMTNFYLNMLPLQDRMEWLSDYVENGTRPFLPVEMGTPLDSTFKRGRNGFRGNAKSELLMTEFLAIYQGPRAYEGETDAYRADVSGYHIGGTNYRYSQNLSSLIEAPTFQELQIMFTENTFKAWRTWGTSAGMIAWADAHGWTRAGNERVSSAEAFTPGHRGTWLPSIEKWKTTPLSENEGFRQFPAGDNLIAHIQPTLAWIAGRPEAFTERSHSFASDSDLTKQVVLINDGKYSANYSVQISVHVGDQVVALEEMEGEIETTERVFLPITAMMPSVELKTDGYIEMTAVIGEAEHTDRFDFRVFPTGEHLEVAANVVDPLGLTSELFDSIGISVDSTSPSDSSLTIIGREAFGSGGALSETTLQQVENGGTALIMIQERAWYESVLGFRVADPISRQVFPVQNGHPALAGLDATDLRNWDGEATLIDAYPDLTTADTKMGSYGIPYYGWRWGSRGAVSSAMLEKPHHSGWTPILEGEFDLAYSPLMELTVGAGRVILCSLDLEDLAPSDPAAAELTRRIVSYASTPSTRTALQPTYYHGGEAGRALLDSLGVIFQESRGAVEAGLLIVGEEHGLTKEQLVNYTETGWDILVLPQSESFDGVEIMGNQPVGGFEVVPAWPELQGLSTSEIRTRAEIKLPVLGGSDTLQTAANGLLGKVEVDGGSIIMAQLNPEALRADDRNYLRYTRWRFTRALSQLIANMGGQFKNDVAVFTPVSNELSAVPLVQGWSYVLTETIDDPEGSRHPDRGLSSIARNLLRSTEPLGDDATSLERPGMLPELVEQNGEAVLQLQFDLPESMLGQDLELSLGKIDDVDTTYVNGQKIADGSGWNTPRVYTVPAQALQAKDNLITVRLWDAFGGGGIHGYIEEFELRVPSAKDSGPSVYHPDYVTDFQLGDDPYRYYRW